MKKVYQVRGSEDGTVGIYTNKKLAWEAAMNYLTEYQDSLYAEYDKSTKPTYAKMCKALKGDFWNYVICSDYPSAEITQFTLNK